MEKINNKDKSGSKADFKSSTASLFLNFTIVILAIVILYLSYSIIIKLLSGSSEEEMSENKNQPSEIIQLEVLNGCGVSGIADKFTEHLRNKKFDVVNVSNYISYDIDKTMVIDRTGNKANAEKIAAALGVKKENVFQQLNNDYFLDVSVIIGKDFNQLLPFVSKD